MSIDGERLAAVKTLQHLGYTYGGGELWKPPLGPSAAPLLDRIAELEAAIRYATWLDGEAVRVGWYEFVDLAKEHPVLREVHKKSST